MLEKQRQTNHQIKKSISQFFLKILQFFVFSSNLTSCDFLLIHFYLFRFSSLSFISTKCLFLFLFLISYCSITFFFFPFFLSDKLYFHPIFAYAKAFLNVSHHSTHRSYLFCLIGRELFLTISFLFRD